MPDSNHTTDRLILNLIGLEPSEQEYVFSPYAWLENILLNKSDTFPSNPKFQDVHMSANGTMYLFENGSWKEIEDIRIE